MPTVTLKPDLAEDLERLAAQQHSTPEEIEAALDAVQRLRDASDQEGPAAPEELDAPAGVPDEIATAVSQFITEIKTTLQGE